MNATLRPTLLAALATAAFSAHAVTLDFEDLRGDGGGDSVNYEPHLSMRGFDLDSTPPREYFGFASVLPGADPYWNLNYTGSTALFCPSSGPVVLSRA